jgi:hypothetical protein
LLGNPEAHVEHFKLRKIIDRQIYRKVLKASKEKPNGTIQKVQQWSDFQTDDESSPSLPGDTPILDVTMVFSSPS